MRPLLRRTGRSHGFGGMNATNDTNVPAIVVTNYSLAESPWADLFAFTFA